jgi:rfaE bifunctional protein nucleotidyltransferase chain/domain
MRSSGQRLVLTNGCFDLIHVGHVRYLAQARSLGDALAVGLNSDASAHKLKGPDRPITSEDERAEILYSLKSVDFVTLFDEDTATELVEAVRPSIYVKGGDYSQDPRSSHFPVEAHAVAAYGGELRIIEYVPDRSTSGIIESLRFQSEESPKETP